jgi:hypothetical protein
VFRLPGNLRRAALGIAGILATVTPALAQFETRDANAVPEFATSLAIGDFNRDGKLDMAVAAYPQTADGISVLLGNGDGTFRSPVYYYGGLNPGSVATADFRSDGLLDLAVADADGIDILLGNGDGTFQPATQYLLPGAPFFVAVGDFNNDHKLDLVFISFGTIGVMFGNGDGTFLSPIYFSPPHTPSSLGVGDFNHDGKLDLAIGEQFGGTSQAQIYLGNGNGTFQLGNTYAVGVSPTSIAVADLRKNGKLNLAVACMGSGAIFVLLGNGNGTFQQAVSYTGPGFAYWVAVADLNGDGKLDLAGANFSLGTSPPTTEVSVFLGNGDGTFGPPTNYPSGGENTYIAVGDFNNDKKPDLAVVDSFNSDALVLLNTGVVSFSPTTPLNFKKQEHGTTSAPQTVTLTNTGTTELKISAMKASAQFGMTSTCRESVAPGAACTISVTFSPKTQGAKSGTVTINDSASSKPMVIELSGSGT